METKYWQLDSLEINKDFCIISQGDSYLSWCSFAVYTLKFFFFFPLLVSVTELNSVLLNITIKYFTNIYGADPADLNYH
jgi:hypothetical protein